MAKKHVFNLLRVFNVTGAMLIAAAVIFLAVYLLGWDLLSGYLIGNDIGMAATAANWFNRYFPNIPQWYPLCGSGVSLTQGTQIGASLITVVLSRLLPFDLIQTMHLWELLTVYFTALGIFTYFWVKFKNYPAAVLAGIFYSLSHASWAWLTEIGLYANGTAFIFYPLAFLTWDLFLTELFGKKRERKLAVWFALTGSLLALAIITHFTAGTVLFLAVGTYGLIFSLVSKGKKVNHFFKGLGLTFSVLLTGALLISFWLFPFLRYIGIASRNLLPSWSTFEQIPTISLSALFGFVPQNSLSINNGMWYVFFPRPIWVLALIGIVFAFLRKNKQAIIAAVIFVLFVFYAVAPDLTPWLVRNLMFFWRNIYIRSLIPAIILVPILAAWGCLAPARWLANSIFKKKEIARGLTTFILMVLIVFPALFFLRGAPPDPDGYGNPCYQGFGRWWRTEINYCHFWDKLKRIDLSVSDLANPFDSISQTTADQMSLDSETRIDISPNQGAMIASWGNVSPASTVTLYWYPMTLHNNFWGYQQRLLYDRRNAGSPEAISEFASWWGTEYMILHKSENPRLIESNNTDPWEKYTDEFWEEVYFDQRWSILGVRYKKSPGLATWANRPTILVLGDREKKAYENVFRRAVNGVLPYQQFLLVEGRDDGRIDKYDLQELQQFDGLILYGQVYEDKAKTDKLLTNYVQNGGRLFIESGWQYTNTEWQTHQALNVIPLERLEWDSQSMASLKLKNNAIKGRFEAEIFAPFIYYNDPWSVSTASKENLKDWGEIILERNDKPVIISGQLGQGKVVWSGMNLFGHLNFHESQAVKEHLLARQMFEWLLEGKESQDLGVSFSRSYPDRIKFTFNQSSSEPTYLLWRENYYPDWQAKLGGKKLKIYRSGPNLMMVFLPPLEKGQSLDLEFKLSVLAIASRILSLLTLIFLIMAVAAPKRFFSLAQKGKKTFSSLSQSILKEEDY